MVRCSERITLKQVYYQVWNRSPAQVGCMRQVLRAGALGRPWGMGRGGRREWGSGWGTHVIPWLIHFNVWPKPLQYCKVVSLQLIKINEKKWKWIITIINRSFYYPFLLLLLWLLLYFGKPREAIHNISDLIRKFIGQLKIC